MASRATTIEVEVTRDSYQSTGRKRECVSWQNSKHFDVLCVVREKLKSRNAEPTNVRDKNEGKYRGKRTGKTPVTTACSDSRKSLRVTKASHKLSWRVMKERKYIVYLVYF